MSVSENGSDVDLSDINQCIENTHDQALNDDWLERNLLRAIALHQAGQIGDAQSMYRKIIQNFPTQANANHNLALILMDAKNVEDSLILFKVALEAAPEEPQYWTSYIEALLQAGQHDEAKLVMSYGIDSGLQGEMVESLRHRLAGLGNVISSKSMTKSVAKTRKAGNPTSAEINALVTLFNQGNLLESERLATILTQNFPAYGIGWKVLGAIHQQQGLVDEALHDLNMATKLLPDDSEAQYNLGNCYYDQQKLDEAVACYKKAIKLNPSFSKAHYNLGNVYKNQANLKLAEASYRKALKIDSNNVQIFCNLAQVLYEQGDLSGAIASYEQALELQFNFSPAHVGLGAIFKAKGSLSESEESFKSALSVNPNDVDAYNNLGALLKESGRFSEAEVCYKAVLTITPESADAYNQLGLIMQELGRGSDSFTAYVKAIKIAPQREDIQTNFGLALASYGQFSRAVICYKKALEITPDYWPAHNNLGLSLQGMGKFSEAESAFNKAIELNPMHAVGYSNLSLALVAQGFIIKAEASLNKAIALDPNYVNAYINLCTNYLAQGLSLKAEAACLQALQVQPDSSAAISNLLFTMNYSGSHSAAYRLEQAHQYGRIVADKVKDVFSSWLHEPPVKRLRVGLVSGDLRQHPVAYFLENWVQHVDASSVELVAYATHGCEDAVTARLKPYFSDWKSLVGLSDQVAAEIIHNDALHLLFDLSGHTAANRLPLFASKPAPVQVSWLGYFATTGVAAMDYFIADKIGVPEENTTQFVEKIKYLPDTRLCFTAPNSTLEVSNLPALTNGYVTFGSFQTRVKAGDDVLALWAEVMLALPTSRLRWQCKSFADNKVADDLRLRLAQYGIHADRVILLESVSREAYLAAHAEVDLILDTFPYPGGTTTCEALWMGVPTLTIAGETLIARQGASLLTAAGLSGWVAQSKVDYVNKALIYASDLERLASIRQSLRLQVLASPLFDASRFAKNMQSALWEMWHEANINVKKLLN